ncbi:MAG TPA: type II toxin-antitoxin system RelE/ParE family toxin [Phycisphaerae bacterium]|nr:type II toxin-antitoxin system RelE/ParE family toxin [Phycisphaerae bacterium]
MKQFFLTPAAEADLAEILDFLCEESPVAAERVLIKIHAAIRKLTENPLLGHLREDLADEPLRFWNVYSYLIVYRAKTSPLQIVRILHGMRNIREILEI